MVCFGNMFIKMPHPETKEMIEKGKASWGWVRDVLPLPPALVLTQNRESGFRQHKERQFCHRVQTAVGFNSTSATVGYLLISKRGMHLCSIAVQLR